MSPCVIQMRTIYSYLATVLIWIYINLHTGECMKCVQCDSKVSGLSCALRPPPPTECPLDNTFAGFGYCMTSVVFSMDRKLMSFNRSCSPVLFEDKCQLGTNNYTGKKELFCYATCNRKACNARHSLPYLVSLIGGY